MFWFIVLLLVVGAGFYIYQKMMAIEREIRAEQEMEEGHVQVSQTTVDNSEESSSTTIFDSESSSAPVESESESGKATSLEDAILAEVIRQPGIKQTELYPLFADVNKKSLQQRVKVMTDRGGLRREKKGSSYLLYPAS